MSTQPLNTVELTQTVEIPWNLLRRGKANVRIVAAGNAADEALIANIADTGLILENLIVSPLEGEEGCYGVHAGGRRWSAIGVNVKKGVLPPSFPVPCRIQTGGSLTAVSLAENLQAPMHPADEFSAIQAMQKEGLEIEEIAARFGLPKQRVLQRLKLAQVAKRIFNAYRKGDIDLQTVMAFTLASSQKQQLEIFKELEGRCHAQSVKRALTDGTINSGDRLVKYIGIEAYRQAGGTFIADMFSDHDYLQDRGLVEQLVHAKLEKAAERLTKNEGWKTVLVTTEYHFASHDYHHIEPEPVGVPLELTQRLARLITAQNELNEMDGEWTPELEAQDDQLTEDIDGAESELDAYRVYSEEQKAEATCFITISDAGKTHISRGYLSRQAESKARAQAKAKARTKAKADGKAAEVVMPQALIDDLGVQRQQIAKAALLSDPALANDVLLYTLCHDVLSPGWETKALDVRINVVAPTADVQSDCKATQCIDKGHSTLPTEWLRIESPCERFAALRTLTSKRKQALMTYCVAATFRTSLVTEGKDTVTEAVLHDLAPDYAALWRPKGDSYFKRLTTPALIALGSELLGDRWTALHSKDKKGPLVEWFDGFFNKPLPRDIDDESREALNVVRKTWLPAGFVREVS